MAKKAPAQPTPKAAAAAAKAPSPVIFASYREAAAMMLEAVANLPLHEAMERLRRAYDDQAPGTAQRALLSARIALLRDNMPARIVLPVTPAPVVQAEPEPPKPLKSGALSTLALEDAARMLFAATEEDEEEEEEPAPAKAAPAAVSAVGDIFAMMDADDEADDAAEVEDSAEAVTTDSDVAAPASDWGTAAFAAFDELTDDDVEIVDLMDEAEPEAITPEPPAPAPKKAKPRKAKMAVDAEELPEIVEPHAPVFHPTPPSTSAADLSDDLSVLAALAAMQDAPIEGEVAPEAPAKPKSKKAKPAAVADLGAAFASMADAADDTPDAPSDALVMAVADRLAGFDDAEAEPLPPVKAAKPKKAKSGMSDSDVAASLAALIGDGPAAPAAPAMLSPDVSDRLTALETAFAEEAKPKPGKKMPTDLSSVAATFAALNRDED